MFIKYYQCQEAISVHFEDKIRKMDFKPIKIDFFEERQQFMIFEVKNQKALKC